MKFKVSTTVTSYDDVMKITYAEDEEDEDDV